MRRPLLPAAAAAGLVLAACGGPKQVDAVNVATTWAKAIAHGEITAACKLTTETGARRLARSYLPDRRDASCGDALSALHDALGDHGLDAGMRATGDVHGGRVDVEPVAAGARPLLLVMRIDGGQWRVDGPPPSGTG